MEIVRPQNTRGISEFYPHEIFEEGDIFEIFWKIKILRFFAKKSRDLAPALRAAKRKRSVIWDVNISI